MDTSKSLVRTNPKPINVFYVWYTELCRRMNCTPAPAVKPAKPKSQTVLEFCADRLRVEEWNPIINALRQDTSLHVINIRSRINNCQFLHDIDTEEKAKHMKRRFGTLWTAYILKQLLKSLSNSLRNTQVLTCLELDGLPMFTVYLEPLLQALKKNKTIKSLSFANCSIDMAGCQLICEYLRFTPNIEVINLSACGLTSECGEHLAKLIKYQQINRYCESWHNSLRYEDPLSGAMRGIKRITINCNREFGDDGLNYLLDELEDDLWIKALDLQKCGVTENIASKIINVVEYNKSLEIVDLRQNDLLNMKTIEKILQLLRDKQQFGYQPEYQWCNTAVSLAWNSLQDCASKFSLGSANIHKTKSAPMKNVLSKLSTFTYDQPVRKSRTVDNVPKIAGKLKKGTYESDHALLNAKLKEEIQKRKAIEKRNEELEHKLEEIKSASIIAQQQFSKTSKTVISSIEVKAKDTNDIISNTRHKSSEQLRSQTLPRQKTCCFGKGDGFHDQPNGYKNGIIKNGFINGIKNGFSSKTVSDAHKIFDRMLKSGDQIEDEMDDKNLLTYFSNDGETTKAVNFEDIDKTSDASGSQVSLLEYMEELKVANNDQATPSVNFKTPSKSKYCIKENQKR